MDFSKQSITALLVGTFSIAAMHALIPSHWLAFAVVGRRQRWTVRQTLTITLLAGTGHILLTVVLGFVLAIVGNNVGHYGYARLADDAGVGTFASGLAGA